MKSLLLNSRDIFIIYYNLNKELILEETYLLFITYYYLNKELILHETYLLFIVYYI